MTNDLKINKKRVTIVITESQFEETIYWIVPKEAELPMSNQKSQI